MTDIVGFTEATVHQSRSAIEVLLATHNRILLPIVRRYRGRHIKSIGDALLLAFRSPTDAMLCAMAMQDALHESNRGAPKDKQIHIRIGASLGEVRVTRGDIFGEPVNLTSRVAGVTPTDEIYLSEALYMAMNKAEVPSKEVGWKELKGIGQPVRVYHIPRYSVSRLVSEAMATDDLTDLVYPFGGAHLADEDHRSGIVTRLKQWRLHAGNAAARRSVRIAAALLLALPAAVLALRLVGIGPAPVADKAGGGKPIALAPVAQTVPVADTSPAVPAPSAAPPAPVSTKPADRPATATAPRMPAPEKKSAPTPAARTAPPPVPVPEYETRISAAKRAYNDKTITKADYKRIVKSLEDAMDRDLDQAKRDYKEERTTSLAYKLRVQEIKLKYE